MSGPESGWEDFEFGFWHPFGSHGRESPEEIINRKRSETEKNGWTLWSFQYRRPESLDEWYRQLTLAKPRRPVVVFCSTGGSAVDPDRPGSLTRTADCREYRFVGSDDADWRPVPPLIRVPHPFGPKKDVASAFVVRCVHHPVKLRQRPFVEWFKGGKWDERKIPTRPRAMPADDRLWPENCNRAEDRGGPRWWRQSPHQRNGVPAMLTLQERQDSGGTKKARPRGIHLCKEHRLAGS
jgi:hypothetical protein